VNLAEVEQPDSASTFPGEPGVGISASSTRHRIMARIMERGHATAAHLADHLGLTQAAVRRHLAALAAQGLVSVRERRAYGPQSPGRPAKVYVPTDRGRGQFAHAYDELAIEVLDYLRQLGGEQAVTAFAAGRFQDLETRYHAFRAAEPSLSPAAALQRVLCETGYMADLAPLETGDQILQHHCPYSAVASRFPELCQAETAAFSRLVHSHVQRLATIAHGDGVCTTHIPHPPTTLEETM
jgi:predicted ArsR family transcriptional regulator